jgi:citrate lyase subunit beta / citryl-CoA lyase
MVFLDLEDSVAPRAKDDARRNIVQALRSDWGAKTVAVRINSIDTQWAADDLETVVGAVGLRIDAIMMPKVEHAHEVMFVDHMLRMIETAANLDRQIAIEAQIETATGLVNVDEIARASSRLETLVFGPADMSASLGIPTVTAGLPVPGYPGDHWHYVLMKILVGGGGGGGRARGGA